ncbi:MAG TPA: DUF5678 domain-containing protein [Gemmataceae bacterium]|jgi:hypothetical protein|nr:DUF5678 domain-containing protein [Gemmataceae bacterium]
MDFATFEQETAVNRKAYETLREQIRRDHAGQYVAMAHGRVIATAATYDDTMAAVEQRKPVPEYFLVFPAEEEPTFEPYDAF